MLMSIIKDSNKLNNSLIGFRRSQTTALGHNIVRNFRKAKH